VIDLTKQLRIPNRVGTDTIVETETSIVIIGANGSGKSSLGAQLDSLSQKTHRIDILRNSRMPYRD
jgi:ABC-type Mn2+/Zn2+ transport system ATPase subunit